MSSLRPLGLTTIQRHAGWPVAQEWVMREQPLRRILHFTGRSIDEVVNSPVVKREVLGYFKLQHFVRRRSEIVDLERHWNPLG